MKVLEEEGKEWTDSGLVLVLVVCIHVDSCGGRGRVETSGRFALRKTMVTSRCIVN